MSVIRTTLISDQEGHGANLRFINLSDFMRRLNIVANEYPKTAEKHLRAIGNKLKGKVRANTPDGKTADHYFKGNKRKKSKVKLKNTWTGKTVGTSGEDLEYQLRSKSKRYHLVERGHVKVIFGKRTAGFVQAKFFFAKTVEEFERSVAVGKEMNKMFREIQKRLEG